MADNNIDIICPACGKSMKKIYISSAKCNLDVCVDGCGGIFFDNMEFKKMDRDAKDVHELIEALCSKEYEKVDRNKDRICPLCNHKMVRHFASAKHEVEIDDCYTCGGTFLDCAELVKVRERFATEEERTEDFNKYLKEELEINFASELLKMQMKDASVNKDHLNRVEKRGQLISKLFKL